MTRAHVLADEDGTLLTRWVKHRTEVDRKSAAAEK